MSRIFAPVAWVVILGAATLDAFEEELKPFVQQYCAACHTGTVLAPLDIIGLGFDLNDPKTFHAWSRIYGRIDRGSSRLARRTST